DRIAANSRVPEVFGEEIAGGEHGIRHAIEFRLHAIPEHLREISLACTDIDHPPAGAHVRQHERKHLVIRALVRDRSNVSGGGVRHPPDIYPTATPSDRPTQLAGQASA